MALTQRLEFRQSQSLVMTPQLMAVTPRGVLPVLLPHEMDDFVFDGARAWGVHYPRSSTGAREAVRSTTFS